jgi:hypothetical protein
VLYRRRSLCRSLLLCAAILLPKEETIVFNRPVQNADSYLSVAVFAVPLYYECVSHLANQGSNLLLREQDSDVPTWPIPAFASFHGRTKLVVAVS